MHELPRTLVTGGAGFLGSHLCDRLIAAGARVVCLDNFYTGRRANIAHLIGDSARSGAAHDGPPRFELLEHNVIEPISEERLGPIDRIYNLACPASPPQYQRDPVFTMKTSVYGAVNMLELAERTGARILHASTSEVYGDPEQHPQPESYRGRVNPIGPRACYDEGKRAAESVFFDFHRQGRADIRVVRIFNTYGPRMHPLDGRVVSNFICQAIAGEDLTIYGDGRGSRAFCYVDDLITGMVNMMEQSPLAPLAPVAGNRVTGETPVPPSSGMRRGDTSIAHAEPFVGPVNLGNPEELTIAALAELVLELTSAWPPGNPRGHGTHERIIRLPAVEDDPVQRQPDIHLAETLLGWRPTVGIREGLARTIAWFRTLDLFREKSAAS